SPEAIEPFLTERGHALIAALQEGAPAATGARKPEADCSLVPCVALTYDDGPDPDQGALLDTLAERDVYATFFFLGMLVESNADQVLRTYEDGHEIANHSWNHPSFTSLSTSQLDSQLTRTQSVLESVTGERPTLVRPPYGALNGPTIAAIDMPIIMWDVDTLDWRSPPVASLIDTA